jgi:L-alanine-DL-glutamate epimerase-like enolase superfamily enzyme
MREVTFCTEPWEFRTPLRITGHSFSVIHLLHVMIRENGAAGHGEATGVYYLGETRDSMLAQVESARDALEHGADRIDLGRLLPPGGARNAIDCALWDLQAKREGRSIWELTGITPRPVQSVHTISIGTPAEMASLARAVDSPLLKVKLDGEGPLERIAAVRAARPDAEVVVDINQGWTFEQLVELAPRFAALGVKMIEQPLPRGGDEELAEYRSPVPLCADESCLDSAEFEQAARCYQMINIKLDKTGGLTEALRLAALARSSGVGLMVGNMVGTSLGMAPGFVVAQLCSLVDLDGALILKNDRNHPISYVHGVMSPPSPELWG